MRGRIRAFSDYMRYVYGSEWAYLIGLLGIIAGFIGAWLPKWFVFWVAGPLGLVITLGLLLKDTLELKSRWVNVDLILATRCVTRRLNQELKFIMTATACPRNCAI